MSEDRKKELASSILAEANKLNGLANLFDAAADNGGIDKRVFDYCGIIGIGEILSSIAGSLGGLVEKIEATA